ncbi:hypothetical protein EJ03DRAFT_292741 [Teratosphaeria nubilosa]|uniref:Uncharacterized protein n=1 Tax=Teratosphaeria nubilosa TaxID=161662 RepID=A0A6G1L9P2_9PEZI|nr:hypothetical protein EJ03DRAFT_292741 [Teratosphaeria nubilosa]
MLRKSEGGNASDGLNAMERGKDLHTPHNFKLMPVETWPDRFEGRSHVVPAVYDGYVSAPPLPPCKIRLAGSTTPLRLSPPYRGAQATWRPPRP